MSMISRRAQLLEALNAVERYAKDAAASWEQSDHDAHRHAERQLRAARHAVLEAFDAEVARLSASGVWP